MNTDDRKCLENAINGDGLDALQAAVALTRAALRQVYTLNAPAVNEMREMAGELRAASVELVEELRLCEFVERKNRSGEDRYD